MTPDQLSNIKYGRSLLTGSISIQDINRRQEWIDRHLLDVLDLALKQHDETEELSKRLIARQEAIQVKLQELKDPAFVHANMLHGAIAWKPENLLSLLGDRVSPLGPLVELVKQWGVEKGITGPNGKGTLSAQADKMMEEAQETYQAVQMLEREGNTDTDVRLWKYSITDGIGDTAVTLILLAELHGVPFTECLQAAYDEIKGRVGAMVDGTFVKNTTPPSQPQSSQ